MGGALRPAAGVTKDYLLAAENKFFCHILDAQMLLVIELWQIENGRARSCLAELRARMPMSIHSHATNSAADLGRITSPLRPSIPHLQTRDDKIMSFPGGEEEKEEGCRRLNSVFVKYSEISR